QVCMDLYPNLIASTLDDSITICPGASTNINMSTIGGSGAGYTYTWYHNNSQIGTGGVINVTPTSSPSTYIGVATDNCTTPADSVTIYVDWFALPNLDFTRNKPDSCYPITINLENASSPFALVGSTKWNISDGAVLNGDTVSHTFGTPVCHDVTMTVTTVDGCVLDTTIFNFVCPHPYPDANFYMTPPITDVLNTEIEFTNLSTGDGLTYLWNFGSGLSPDTSAEQNPVFVYPNDNPGQYNVLLTVTNQYGCVDTISGTVFVNDVYLFYVPNAFTPDGDGKNEIFRPYGDGIDFTQYSMQIFDRWGELIFETTNAERGWDGTYKGNPVKVDTYIWKIIAKEADTPIIHDNFGHVNLIR
ncbi:MAG: gliding motility-associated C-terminal domain-containing protein, partial [Flavobacteriales bacterium]|nr:gliding motility-associated C-terminal domain-containing protein [Flavobacteriales bacterium]